MSTYVTLDFVKTIVGSTIGCLIGYGIGCTHGRIEAWWTLRKARKELEYFFGGKK